MTEKQAKAAEQTEQTETVAPGLGDTVLLKLSTEDAVTINRRRQYFRERSTRFRQADGGQQHVGNVVAKGEVVVAKVSRVYEDGSLNLRAELDGSDIYWAVGRREGSTGGTWAVKK